MADAKKKDEGVHDTQPRKSTVDTDAYPERSYADAVTKEHREYLESQGVEVA